MGTSSSEESGSDLVVVVAVEALTEVAGRQRVAGAGAGAGASCERVEPVDFAGVVCQVLASVAANVGGVEVLLAGRAGSREADCVRRAVRAAAGVDEVGLWRFRTAPVRVVVDVAGLFEDFGLVELFEQEASELRARAGLARAAVLAAFLTPAERARLGQIRAEGGADADPEQDVWVRDLDREYRAVVADVLERARRAGGPLADAWQQATGDLEAVRELWEQDQAVYRRDYLASIRAVLAARGACVEVLEVAAGQQASVGDPLVDELHEYALGHTVLPITGQVPDWNRGSPADAARRAGRTWRARVAALRAADVQDPGAPA